jgi:hypothetical protein
MNWIELGLLSHRHISGHLGTNRIEDFVSRSHLQWKKYENLIQNLPTCWKIELQILINEKKKVSVNEGNQKSLTKFTRWPSFGSNCPNFTIYVTGQWIDATDEIQSKSPDWFMKVTITFPLVTKLFTRKWSFKQLFFL